MSRSASACGSCRCRRHRSSSRSRCTLGRTFRSSRHRGSCRGTCPHSSSGPLRTPRPSRTCTPPPRTTRPDCRPGCTVCRSCRSLTRTSVPRRTRRHTRRNGTRRSRDQCKPRRSSPVPQRTPRRHRTSRIHRHSSRPARTPACTRPSCTRLTRTPARLRRRTTHRRRRSSSASSGGHGTRRRSTSHRAHIGRPTRSGTRPRRTCCPVADRRCRTSRS